MPTLKSKPIAPTKPTPTPPPQPNLAPVDVIIPPIQVRQPDGSLLLKAGKPQVVESTISCKEAARLLGLSIRTVSKQCLDGDFKTAHKPGGKKLSQWRLTRAEVLARKERQLE